MASSASIALRTHLRNPRPKPLYNCLSPNAVRRIRTTNVQQRRRWTLLPDAQERRLKRLLDEANSRAHDPEIQAVYLRALGKTKPQEVVRRVELGKYAAGDNVLKEYVRALVKTGAIDRINLPKLIDSVAHSSARASAPLMGASTSVGGPGGTAATTAGLNSNTATSALAGLTSRVTAPSQGGTAAADAAAAAAATASGTANAPIHVSLAEPSMFSQLWRAVRVLGTTFLVLGFLGVMMEERGMSRGMGINLDKAPEPEPGDATSFEDVKGCDEAKAELEEIVHFLRQPYAFTRLGGKLPKGILLMGPPGTGKTLLARAIAGEAKRPFFYASGSEFEEMFVGVGAKRVRELFAAAKQHAPCIIFIDEIDAIGGKRNPKDQRFLTMTLNQFLVEMDGFQSSEGIIVIGATNFPESLDKALIRPGRFDRHVVVPVPDIRGRVQILDAHTRKIPLEKDVDLEIIARGTPGFSGAELANLVNMAALKAAVEDFAAVTMSHLEYAKDKIIMGAERKSAALSEDTRRMTAYHEGGHALCCLFTKEAFPVHKATIMPRGQALGLVAQLPEKDMTSMSKAQMVAKIDVCMGGRAAEEMIFGEEKVTSGASSDFEQATQMAEAMVTRYGMSEKLGMVVYDKERESGETRAMIESEVKRILDDSYARVSKLLRNKEKELHRLAEALLKYESLTGEQVTLAVRGELSEAMMRMVKTSRAQQLKGEHEATAVLDARGAVGGDGSV
ncbi:unnamed protein product [Agarophyton chilense]|eukprot:gb/GEZJ01001608.1/.p1 GENE.gb/GEZJ01001608.1/~~gb/GEZJ01001608.1/.p1  ORF type:complete len:733 (+),score=94.51 gb/GEZJ01001608.1/:225-2423(+)